MKTKLKRIISELLAVVMLLIGCAVKTPAPSQSEASEGISEEEYSWDINTAFDGLDDIKLQNYLVDVMYGDITESLPEGYYLENISSAYISKEYIEELSYNSKENVFFGYCLSELDRQFQGQKYVFTLDENGQTTVKRFEENVNTSFDTTLKNVAVGSGVILVCATVSAVSGGLGAPAVSMIFALSAKTGAVCAASSAAAAGFFSGIASYTLTGETDEAFETAMVGASEGFKIGAITGAISGGASEAIGLKAATKTGLSMNEAAIIQKSGYPLDVIQNFTSMEQFEICQKAGLRPEMVNGNTALVRDINLNFKDEMGRTNLERMKKGLAALDPSGKPYELHHIGQKTDSTLAILTKEEHMQGGNNKIWHLLRGESQIDRKIFGKTRRNFWKEMANILNTQDV